MASQPFKCNTQEEFEQKLAIVKQALAADNVDGLLDVYSGASIVLWQTYNNQLVIVNPERSHETSMFDQHLNLILQAIAYESNGVIPPVTYISD